MRFSFMFGLLAYTENPQRPKSSLFVRIFRETNSLYVNTCKGNKFSLEKSTDMSLFVYAHYFG